MKNAPTVKFSVNASVISYCPKCNRKVYYGWNFCPGCGEKISYELMEYMKEMKDALMVEYASFIADNPYTDLPKKVRTEPQFDPDFEPIDTEDEFPF